MNRTIEARDDSRGERPIPEWMPQELSHAYLLATMLKSEWIASAMERLGRYGAREVRGLENAEKISELIGNQNPVFVPVAPHRKGYDAMAGIVLLHDLVLSPAGKGADKLAVFPSGKYLTKQEGRIEGVPGLGMVGRGYRAMRRELGFAQYPLYQAYLKQGLTEDVASLIDAANMGVVADAVNDLRRGVVSVAMLFPEGTRNPKPQMLRWEAGVGVMAKQVARHLEGERRVWVAPLLIKGMDEFVEKKGPVKYLNFDKGFEVEFLPPIELAELEVWSKQIRWAESPDNGKRGFKLADAMAVYSLHMCDSGFDDERLGVYSKENLQFV